MIQTLPEYDYPGDPFEAIKLPVPREKLNDWVYEKSVEHANKHFSAQSLGFSSPLADLRGYLGKELEFLADLLGYKLPDNPADVHVAFIDLADNSVSTAYEDIFGEY